jgi:hypothetical protein
MAYGQNAVIFNSKTIQNDTTLIAEKPYWIFGDLTIDSAKTLTIEKGCKLYFYNKANLIVKGNLIINGTAEYPVILRGDRLDYYSSKYKYDDLFSGQWGGIYLQNGGQINYANIRNGKSGITITKHDETVPILNIGNSVIQNFENYGINAAQAEIYINNVLVANCGTNCLRFVGGKYDIVQSTITNYYGNSYKYTQLHRRKDVSVSLSNFDSEKEIAYPLQIKFSNTILYGSYTEEISFNKNEETQADFEYLFQNCLLKQKEQDADNEHYENVIWNTSPEFIKTDEPPYDFHLQETSPALSFGAVF